MKLSILLRQKLHGAIVESFADYEELNLATELYLGEHLSEIAPPAAMPVVAMKAIVWAETRGRLPELIDAARQSRPQNDKLLDFSRDAQAAFAAMPAAAGNSSTGVATSRPALERVILKSVEFAHTVQWRANMAACERTVCRVESPVNQGMGTGFLIAPDLLLTNYHVLKDFIETRNEWSSVACRFGYAADTTGKAVSQGEVYTLSDAPLVASSQIDAPNLDYAIVRLSASAGSDVIDGGPRGWLRPWPQPPTDGDPIFIIQHPKAAPLRVTTGAHVGADLARVRYQANTLDGSSGSPCFNANWKLVALHSGAGGSANVGVPIIAISADLAQKGLPDLLAMANA